MREGIVNKNKERNLSGNAPIFNESEVDKIIKKCGKQYVEFIYNDEYYCVLYCEQLDVFIVYKGFGKTMTTDTMDYIGYGHGIIDFKFVIELIEEYG